MLFLMVESFSICCNTVATGFSCGLLFREMPSARIRKSNDFDRSSIVDGRLPNRPICNENGPICNENGEIYIENGTITDGFDIKMIWFS